MQPLYKEEDRLEAPLAHTPICFNTVCSSCVLRCRQLAAEFLFACRDSIRDHRLSPFSLFLVFRLSGHTQKWWPGPCKTWIETMLTRFTNSDHHGAVSCSCSGFLSPIDTRKMPLRCCILFLLHVSNDTRKVALRCCILFVRRSPNDTREKSLRRCILFLLTPPNDTRKMPLRCCILISLRSPRAWKSSRRWRLWALPAVKPAPP